MRIVAGRLKGRTLKGPAGAGVRPTSDGLRETLFNVLGDQVDGARMLDGCAGTGAVGLEAISRGATHATFIEKDRAALAVIRQNIGAFGVEADCEVIPADMLAFGHRGPVVGPFDIVFLDPPYDEPAIDAMLTSVARWVSPSGVLVLEHSKRRASPEQAGVLVRYRILKAGDSALSFYGHSPRADTMKTNSR